MQINLQTPEQIHRENRRIVITGFIIGAVLAVAIFAIFA